MSKQQKQGHYCRICQTYHANEKFSGKGHRQHVCKACQRELQAKQRVRKQANKQAIETGLRPLKKRYPKSAKQAASYLQISLDTFEAWCEKLDLAPCEVQQDAADPVALYDIEAIITIHQQLENHRETEPSSPINRRYEAELLIQVDGLDQHTVQACIGLTWEVGSQAYCQPNQALTLPRQTSRRTENQIPIAGMYGLAELNYHVWICQLRWMIRYICI